MTTDPVRRHRRLLWAYPRWHRRRYGPDLLTTVLDAGRTGRRDRLLLVLDGLRCRLRVHGAGGIVVAALSALVGAGLAVALAGYLAWQATAAPIPTVRQATALAAPVLPRRGEAVPRRDEYGTRPGRHATEVTRSGTDFATTGDPLDAVLTPLVGDPEEEVGGVTIQYDTALPAGPLLRRQENGLRSRGWHTRVVGDGLVAYRGPVRILVRTVGGDTPNTTLFVVTVAPQAPAATYAWSAAGMLLGLLAGWLVAAAAIADNRHGRHPTRTAAEIVVVFGLLFSLPAAVLTIAFWAGSLAGFPADRDPLWGVYRFALLRPAAILGAALLLVCLALAHRRAPARIADPPYPALR